MCRILVVPTNFSYKETIDILIDMEKGNTDGFGYCYLNENKEFVVRKYASSLSQLLKRKIPILEHLPYNRGATLIHLRSASIGTVNRDNSHPYLTGHYCTVHNGTWHQHKIAKLCLAPRINFVSDTDSEVAAHLIELIGPRKFSEEMDFGGVFVSMKDTGDIYIAKVSGSISTHRMKNGQGIIASDFEWEKYKNRDLEDGYYRMDPDGKCITLQKKNFEICSTKSGKTIWEYGKKSYYNAHNTADQYRKGHFWD